MDIAKLTQALRTESSHTAQQFVSRVTKYKPPHTSRILLIKHYINEANCKFSLFEEIVMGKKNKANVFGSIQFCAISLDTPGKEKARLWLEKHGKDLDTFAVEMVRDGWKSSFSWDEYNDCFIASATMRDEGDKNYDICVTSRSDNMWDAMLLNYYKIYVLMEKTKLPTEKPKDNWG